MTNPQQPELGRSRKVPSQDQDAVAAVVEAPDKLDTTEQRGSVPPDNQPGHRPEEDQDKPDLGAFAARLGVVPPGEGTTGGADAAAQRGEDSAAGTGERPSPHRTG